MKSFIQCICMLVTVILIGDLSHAVEIVRFRESINPPPKPPGWIVGSGDIDLPISRPSTFSGREKGKIVGEHNNHRRRVIPRAADMVALRWDGVLAAMAQGWSDQCIFEHGNPENTSPFDHVGQNLYIRYTTKTGQSIPSPDIPLPIQRWYDEVTSYTYANRSCTAVCGHFTQLVWARTSLVGCGQTLCDTATDANGKIYKSAWIVTCNYGQGGNYRGQWPYTEGERCSKCRAPGTCKGAICKECDLAGDSACTCNIQCENCGFTNSTTGKCVCICQKGFWGTNCQKPCENTNRYCGTNPGWPNKSYCGRHPSIPKNCPLMCGVCEKPDPDFVCEK